MGISFAPKIKSPQGIKDIYNRIIQSSNTHFMFILTGMIPLIMNMLMFVLKPTTLDMFIGANIHWFLQLY